MTSSPSIVVVDLDHAYLDLMQEFLNDIGFRAQCWHGAEGIVEFVERCVPDLVIIDSWLASPSDGQHLLDSFRANPATRDIPIVVVTSDASFRHYGVHRSFASAILEKPFDLIDLENCIYSVLDQRGNGDIEDERRRQPRMDPFWNAAALESDALSCKTDI